jgi:hypothetical protein
MPTFYLFSFISLFYRVQITISFHYLKKSRLPFRFVSLFYSLTFTVSFRYFTVSLLNVQHKQSTNLLQWYKSYFISHFKSKNLHTNYSVCVAMIMNDIRKGSRLLLPKVTINDETAQSGRLNLLDML